MITYFLQYYIIFIMFTKDSSKMTKAEPLLARYVDALPPIDPHLSGLQIYNQARNNLDSTVSVSLFNKVRFLSKFRQT